MTTKTTAYDKVENGNGILETATPHPALSRKGGGNGYDKDTKTTKALSVSGLPLATTRPRNDDYDYGL
jgi:hypothetical protein